MWWSARLNKSSPTNNTSKYDILWRSLPLLLSILSNRMQSSINIRNHLSFTNASWWFRAPSIWFTYNISFSFHCTAIYTFVFYKVTQLVGGWFSTDSFCIRNYRRWTPIWGGEKIEKCLFKRTVHLHNNFRVVCFLELKGGRKQC